jgi:pyridoxal phosphate-dependent aminotransferase EpsN
MDPDLLVKAIQTLDQEGALSRVKAIMVVHAYGWPAEMDRIMEISKSYGIPLIEDAAESLGAKWRGKSTGTFGQFGAYSFNGNKIITTSGGGALLCPDEVSYEHALFLATQAKEPAPDGMQGRVGYNYRLSNVLAALGTAQIKTMEQRMDQRRANRERYRSYFSGWTEEMSVQFTNGWAHGQPNYWMTNVFFKKERWRYLVENALEDWNIECRRIWKPIHLMAPYSAARFYSLREAGSVAQDLYELGTSLPSGSSLSEPDWKRIFHALDQAKHEIERLL